MPIIFKRTKEQAIKECTDYPWRFKSLSESLRNDKDVALVAIQGNYHVIEEIGTELRSNKEFFQKAEKYCGCGNIVFESDTHRIYDMCVLDFSTDEIKNDLMKDHKSK